MINAYTVIGQPIAHSLSPPIHLLFGELTQRRISYTRTEGTPETFADIVVDWQAHGGRGCNVTAPFKEQAVAVCTRLARSAERAGAVNTIHMQRDGGLIGYSTDGSGLMRDIESNIRFDVAGKRVLILGAGGAARGVVGPLLDAGPSALHIANRTVARAESILQAFVDDPSATMPMSASPYEALNGLDPFDLVINATGLSLTGSLPDLPDGLLVDKALAYDMTYSAEDTVFMGWAGAQGALVSDGFGMLVEQAAEAFLIWEGVRPKTRMAWPRLQELFDAQ